MNKTNKKLEYKRKTFHIFLGITLSFIIWNFRKLYVLPILTLIIMIGVVIRFLLLKGFKFKLIGSFLDNFGRPLEVGMGALYFFIGSWASVVLFFPRESAAIAILILGISDGLATIVGINCKKKIYKNKSLGGSLTFLISSFIILYLFINPIDAIIIAIILSIFELFSPIDDNLILSIIGTLLISIFSNFKLIYPLI